MKFGKIDALRREVTIIECAGFAEAKAAYGLKLVDFGVLWHRHAVGGAQIVVAEFGLFEPVATQRYFAIGTRLYAGNALLFAYNGVGVTVDFLSFHLDMVKPKLRFFDDADAVGEIERPATTYNGEVLWQWPQPKPDLRELARRAAEDMP